jgi:hypothetical protein
VTLAAPAAIVLLLAVLAAAWLWIPTPEQRDARRRARDPRYFQARPRR